MEENLLLKLLKKTGLSSVGVKNRIEKLIGQGVLKIQGGLRMESFHSVSAYIGVEADKRTVIKLIATLEKSPMVYHYLLLKLFFLLIFLPLNHFHHHP